MSVFKFKEFNVSQSNSAMKIGTDAILLGALVKLRSEHTILDIGSGTGVVSLMCAQQIKSAKIFGIEVDQISFAECQNNYEKSPWSSRLRAIHGDFSSHTFEEKFDLIISNPPYYANGLTGNIERLNKAKHIDQLTPNKFFEGAVGVLNLDGRIVIIVASESSDQWKESALDKGLFLTHQLSIYGKEEGPEKRQILTFSKKNMPRIFEEFTIRKRDGTYSEEYKRATIDFHGVELK